jgi:hypothetical protein
MCRWSVTVFAIRSGYPNREQGKRRPDVAGLLMILDRDRFVRPIEWLHGLGDVGCGRGQRVYRI